MEHDIAEILGRLAAMGSNAAELCRASGIARSTWDRWVRGETAPNMVTWAKVRAAVTSIENASAGAVPEAAE